MADRPKIGPADAATRRKKLDEELNKPSRAEGVAPKPKPAAKKKAKGTTLGGLLDPNQERDRTVEGENTGLMEAVQRGVKEGSKKRRDE